MTTSNSRPKWALIGVRVCAVYLTLLAITCIVLVFIIANNSILNGTFGWPMLLMFMLGVILVALTALKLWLLRPWARGGASGIFISHTLVLLLPFVNLLTLSIVTPGDFLYGIMWAAIGIIGWIFLNRPAVKVLFQNQQSAIQNPKS